MSSIHWIFAMSRAAVLLVLLLYYWPSCERWCFIFFSIIENEEKIGTLSGCSLHISPHTVLSTQKQIILTYYDMLQHCEPSYVQYHRKIFEFSRQFNIKNEFTGVIFIGAKIQIFEKLVEQTYFFIGLKIGQIQHCVFIIPFSLVATSSWKVIISSTSRFFSQKGQSSPIATVVVLSCTATNLTFKFLKPNLLPKTKTKLYCNTH